MEIRIEIHSGKHTMAFEQRAFEANQISEAGQIPVIGIQCDTQTIALEKTSSDAICSPIKYSIRLGPASTVLIFQRVQTFIEF